jgi:hypothetical protein
MNKIEKWEKAELIDCACGCGTKIKPFDKYGRERKFVIGHSKKPFSSHNRYGDNIMIDCACGCGTKINAYDKRGRPVKRIYGHVVNKIYYSAADQRREWIKKNHKHYKDTLSDWKRRRKVSLIKTKGNKCEKCGVEYNGKNGGMFQFHHINPSLKEFNLGTSIARKSWNKLLEEIKKCLLLCSNCHDLEHSCEF